MKVLSPFLMRLHLDRTHYILTARGVQMVKELFMALDTRKKGLLDDVQFMCFMKAATDQSEKVIYKVFDMFDPESTGWIDFHSFYLLVCMLISIKV